MMLNTATRLSFIVLIHIWGYSLRMFSHKIHKVWVKSPEGKQGPDVHSRCEQVISKSEMLTIKSWKLWKYTNSLESRRNVDLKKGDIVDVPFVSSMQCLAKAIKYIIINMNMSDLIIGYIE